MESLDSLTNLGTTHVLPPREIQDATVVFNTTLFFRVWPDARMVTIEA